MCRNIRPLYNFEPPATQEEAHDAALQFVRKVSGFTQAREGQRGGVRARRRRDHRGDDGAARRPRDERAAQGPRGRGGQGARPVGAALRRVGGSRAVASRIRQGASRLLCLSCAFTGELGSGASRPSPRCWCRRSPRPRPAATGRSRASTASSGARRRPATTCASRPRSARRPRATTRWRRRAAARRAAPSAPTCASRGSSGARRCPGDRVCVTPATWQQVHDDNLTAGARRNALRVKSGPTRDDTSAPRYWVRADGINVGMARVGAVRARRPRRRASPGPCAPARNPTGPGGAALHQTALPAAAAHAGLRRSASRTRLAALVLAAPRRHGLRRPLGRNRPAFWSQDDH